MAIIKCPECGKEVSNTCDTCIHCGFKLKQPITIVKKEEEKEDMVLLADRDRSEPSNQTAIALIVVGVIFLFALLGLILLIIGVIMLLDSKNESKITHGCAYYSRSKKQIVLYTKNDEELRFDPMSITEVFWASGELKFRVNKNGQNACYSAGSCKKNEADKCIDSVNKIKNGMFGF